jgi:hypothetical protein
VVIAPDGTAPVTVPLDRDRMELWPDKDGWKARLGGGTAPWVSIDLGKGAKREE